MTSHPQIALLRGIGNEQGELESLLSRCGDVLVVDDIAELSDAPRAIALPVRLASGGTVASVALRAKSTRHLALVPVAAFTSTKDGALIRSLFDVGVDTVFVPPFEADLIAAQLEALSRRAQLFRELMEEVQFGSSFRQPLAEVLDLVPTATMVFAVDESPLLWNEGAAQLLGIDNDAAARTFYPILHAISGVYDPMGRAVGVRSVSGAQIRVRVRGRRIRTAAGAEVGAVFALQDVTALDIIRARLEEESRALIVAVQLKGEHVAAEIQAGRAAGSGGEFAFIFDRLVEFLDGVVDPGLELRTHGATSTSPVGEATETFQLLALLALFVAHNGGGRGEMDVFVEQKDDALRVMFVMHPRIVRPHVLTDELDLLLSSRSDLGTATSNESREHSAPHTSLLDRAQILAKRSTAQIEFDEQSREVMKVRIVWRAPPAT